MNDNVVERRQAMIGDILCVQIPPGEKVFETKEGQEPRLLGTVYDGHPVVNVAAQTCYLSTNDFLAAEAVLPKPKEFLH
jgi:hypothetical protein